MRQAAAAILISLTSLMTGVGVAHGQDHGAETLDAPDVRGLGGPGTISASPMRSVQSASTPVAGVPKGNTGVVARVFRNGTPMDDAQAGANALGNTGGMTTGARGSASAIAGGVHSRQLVVAPAPIDGAVPGAEMREPPRADVPDATRRVD